MIFALGFTSKLSLATTTTTTTSSSSNISISGKAERYQTFREWKSAQVQVVLGRMAQYKNIVEKADKSYPERNLANTKPLIMGGSSANRRVGVSHSGGSRSISSATEAGLDSHIQQAERSLGKENVNLEIANELSLTDYVVGYLAKIKARKGALVEVAERLTPEEVAELMAAFTNAVTSSAPIEEVKSQGAASGNQTASSKGNSSNGYARSNPGDAEGFAAAGIKNGSASGTTRSFSGDLESVSARSPRYQHGERVAL